MKYKLTISALFFFLSTVLFAQNEPHSAPLLTSADVENLIEHFPQIRVELEKLNLDIDPQDDLESLTDNLENYEEVNTIVKKYGYTDYFEFAAKSTAIVASYAAIKMKDGGGSEIQKAYKAIEMDESMTPEQKLMAKQQLEAVLLAMSGTITSTANEKDIATVKPYISKLDALLKEE